MKRLIIGALSAIAVILPTSAVAETFWKENHWTIYDISEEGQPRCQLVSKKKSMLSSGNSIFTLDMSEHGNFISFGDSSWNLPVDGIVEDVGLSFFHEGIRLPVVFRDRWLAVDSKNIMRPISEEALYQFETADELLIADNRPNRELRGLILLDLTGSKRALSNLKACKFYADMRRDLASR